MKFISINHKMLAISIIGCLLVSILTAGIMRFIVQDYVKDMESQHIDVTYKNLELILNHEESDLKRTNLDWAQWDDTYAYLDGKGVAEYEKANLQAETMQHLHLNFMIFIDAQGKIRKNLNRNMTAELEDLIISKILFQRNVLFIPVNNSDVRSGILSAGGQIFLVSFSPITTTDEKSLSNGMLIVGRVLDNALFYYINSVSQAKIEMYDYTGKYKEKDHIDRDEDFITAYRQITDLLGKPDILVKVIMPRYDYHLGKHYILIFTAIVFALVSLVFLVLILVIHKYFLKRLNQIHQFIDGVTKKQEYKSRLAISGKDEIAKIAWAINHMLAEIAVANAMKNKINERIRSIFEATNEGYFEYNLQTKEYYISPKWSHFICANEHNMGDPLGQYMKSVHPAFKQTVKRLFVKLIRRKQNYAEALYKLINAEKREFWVLHKSRVIERDRNGQAIRIVSMFFDVTKRMEYEEKILHLSYYDKLTNLRNRAYIEEKFDAIKTNNRLKYHIIMGDVNGLKLVNDTFGHQAGDQLIQQIAALLVSVCNHDDSIARWGGDEFIILICNKDDFYVDAIIAKFQAECSLIRNFGFKITMALGYASSQELDDVEAVMNLAEERMYRNKLLEEKSVRNATIVSLEQTLYEKNAETEAHTRRIKELATQLGKKLNLSQNQLNELELLSLLHDIGKIGIPENILLKPGPLTEDEWKIMKQHTEIGYRIAMATPGLSHVAKEILCHHERFDGTGYPQGVKGEEIPILSRIISIVDSFDVIIHKRNYKEAHSIEYAIKELERCAGTQFDLKLVKLFIAMIEEERFKAKEGDDKLGTNQS